MAKVAASAINNGERMSMELLLSAVAGMALPIINGMFFFLWTLE